jgi:hypothetical protein
MTCHVDYFIFFFLSLAVESVFFADIYIYIYIYIHTHFYFSYFIVFVARVKLLVVVACGMLENFKGK